MVYKLYLSSECGNMLMKNQQWRMQAVLDSRKIDLEIIDIAADEEQKEFMKNKGKPEEDGKPVLPPQLFKDDEFFANYTQFEEYVESNELEVKLGLAEPKKKKDPVIEKEEKEDEEEEKSDAEEEKNESDDKDEKPEADENEEEHHDDDDDDENKEANKEEEEAKNQEEITTKSDNENDSD